MASKQLVDVNFGWYVDQIGRDRVLRELRIHRSTLARWLHLEHQAPRSVQLLLRAWATGLLPGQSDEWHGWKISGDRLVLPDGSSYRAREIEGWRFQIVAHEALQTHARRLEAQLIEAVRLAPRETANDAFANGQDVRSRAFR